MKRHFSNMKVGARLALAFGIVLALLSGVAQLGIARLNVMNPTITEAVDFHGNENNLISQSLGSAQDAATAMDRYNDFEKKLSDLFSHDLGTSDNQAAADAHAAYASSIVLLSVLSGIGIVTGVVVASLATRSITVPSTQAVQVAETVAARDLTSRVETHRMDEIGQLLRSLKTMNGNLAGVGATMAEVKQSIKEVSDIIGEIAAASEEQSRGIEQVNQAVSQMDEVTQHNAALVEQAAAAAQSLEEPARNLCGAVSVSRLVDAMRPVPRAIVRQVRPRRVSPRKPVTSRKSQATAKAYDDGTSAAVATSASRADKTRETF